MSNDHDKIVHIEAQLKHLEDDSKLRTKQIAELDKKLDALSLELSRYRGFVGGILLVVTAVVTFFKLFWGDLVDKFK